MRCRRCDHRRVFLEARQALLMELRIGNRTALLAHSHLAEGAVCLQHSSVMVALHDVLAGRRGIGVGGHGHDCDKASRCESQTGRNLKNHDNHLQVEARVNVEEAFRFRINFVIGAPNPLGSLMTRPWRKEN